jgi:hypothetical protein
MKVSLTVKAMTPRVDVFKRKLHTNMSRLWFHATREFVKEIIKDGVIHVDTGMSKSSVAPLGRAVRYLTEVRRTIKPVRSFTNRNASLGEKAGENAFDLDYGTPDGQMYKFEFRIVVYQYRFWEHEWRSLERAGNAFETYLRDNAINYIPPLSEWFTQR